MNQNQRINIAMQELRSIRDIDTLWIKAHALAEKKILDVEQSDSVAPKRVIFFVGDVQHMILEMEAAIDAHKGKGFSPPWGTLYIYDEAGVLSERVQIPQGNYKTWG